MPSASCLILLCGLFPMLLCAASSLPRLSLESLIQQSDTIVEGRVVRKWAAMDSENKFIWTHYELAVSAAHKGKAGSTVIFSEPGGVAGGMQQAVADAVRYEVGDSVFIFLQRMPNGYLRTTGWAQGKYTVDRAGRVHAAASLAGGSHPLDGIAASDLAARVTARMQIKSAGAK